MSSMLESIMGALQTSGGVGQISRSTGMDEGDVSSVVAAALPALLAGLNRNSQSGEGAGSLLAALDRDHDGSVLDDLAGFLGGGAAADSGAGILGHAFGGRQANVESAVSRSSGVDAATVARIMAMVAPIVMGYLAKQRREQNLDATGLSNMLGREQQVAQQRAPEAFDMLSRMMDADNDGSMVDDIADLGSNLLGSLFKS